MVVVVVVHLMVTQTLFAKLLILVHVSLITH